MRLNLRPAQTPPSLPTLVMLAALGALATNVFLPSLPHMAREFGVDYGLMALCVPLYLAASALLQLGIGPVSDRFGRRRVMLWALAAFLVATAGCLMAPHIAVFLAFRVMQAVAAAGMVLSRAAVRDMVSDDEAASRIGYLTMGMSVVPMLAPALGGALDARFGWEGSFWLMALAGLITWLVVYRDMGETARGGGLPLREQIKGYPVLARSIRFWGYSAAAMLSSGAFFAYLGGAPFVGAEVYGMDPATLGRWFGAPAVGYFLGNFLSGRHARRVGITRMVFVGSLCVVAATSLMLIAPLAGLAHPFGFFGPVMLVGLGNGLVLPSANAGMMSVRPELAGTASGLGGAMTVGGGAALAALAGAMLTPGSGALPLVLTMLGSALGALLAVFWVMARERQLRL